MVLCATHYLPAQPTRLIQNLCKTSKMSIKYGAKILNYIGNTGHFNRKEELRSLRRTKMNKNKEVGSVAKRCGHSPYTIPNILAFDFSVLFVGYFQRLKIYL